MKLSTLFPSLYITIVGIYDIIRVRAILRNWMDGTHALDLGLLPDGSQLVDVNPVELDFLRGRYGLFCDFREEGRQQLTRSTPGCPKVENDDFPTSVLPNYDR